MFKVNFLANQMVEDVDINAIGYNLANTAYTSFSNETTYGVDALNEITQQVVTAGVKRGAGENCAVSMQDNAVLIRSGTAFFNSGATMVIDDEGIGLEMEDNTQTNYVYLFLDTALNVAGARCTTSMPSTLDCILLAEVSGSGTVTQNIERFCKNKIHDAPNTPLVIYNAVEKSGFTKDENQSPLAIEETISVPGLSNYAALRVDGEKNIKYIPQDRYTGSGRDYTEEGWWSTGSLMNGGKFGVFDLYAIRGANVNYVTIVEWNNYTDFVFDGVATPRIRFGLGYNSYGYIELLLDFENESITFVYTAWVRIEPNAIKLTFYSGEVE